MLASRDLGAVRVLRLDRPERRNALSTALVGELIAAARRAEEDAEIGCTVITGAGSCFSAGADLFEFSGSPAGDGDASQLRTELFARLVSALSRMDKPVVTAVNGAALGTGAALALAGDIVLIADDGWLAYPEIPAGRTPTAIVPNLAGRIGAARAFELLALGERIAAARAVELGLASRVVASQALEAEALRVAGQLAVNMAAVAATKRLLRTIGTLPLAEALRIAAAPAQDRGRPE